ncbi:MAG TPA: bifunctional pyr operon transcriptional regulator/uracil phosphoribosyltransferase PyrR [Armatimonadetes bacterium]|nr:bifunctional pyr operon transcriptional regulator/uracil phosphoribosyltransferase PyrR [Armatimonadota bacterium]
MQHREKPAEVMDAEDIRRALTRIAHEILERNKGAGDVVIVGIRRRGAPLAYRLARLIERFEGVKVPVGEIDPRPHRDDIPPSERHRGGEDIPVEVDGKTVVLVDEVIQTGRTARAALDALIDWGRPGRVQLAVLVDRGHRELPIRPDYVGKNIPTSRKEYVKVLLSELDGEDKVIIERREGAVTPSGAESRGGEK